MASSKPLVLVGYEEDLDAILSSKFSQQRKRAQLVIAFMHKRSCWIAGG